jgi:hypothetical protein
MVKMPVRSIIGGIDAAARRWIDPGFASRVRALDAVGARTGYARPAVEYAFDCLFGTLRAQAIEAVIADELGTIDALDAFVERDGRPRARAVPLGRVCIISSRTTIGVAIIPAIFALCAKCDVHVKDREDYLVSAFFETLAGELPEMHGAATAQAWLGESDLSALHRFDGVVAFGSDAALTQIAAALPDRIRFIGFGSKASAGYVTRTDLQSEESARAIANGAAVDLSLYETEGCLSLRVLFVERGGAISVRRFTEILTDATRMLSTRFPPSAPDAKTALRVAAVRDLAMFRGEGRAQSAPDAGYLAVVDPPFEEPPVFLPRTIGIHSVDDAADVAGFFERHAVALEALAVTEARDDLIELAVRLHASRVAPFGALQAPPLGAFHGGRPRIAEFIRWVTSEA